MPIQLEAIFENGVLKFDQRLPLRDQERVVVTIETKKEHARQSYGLVAWTGTAKELDELLNADNQPWGEAE
jgi:predicted DNA-binding antitoxin AbrB/MazE fold protein